MKRLAYNVVVATLMLLFFTALPVRSQELNKRVNKSFNIRNDTGIELNNQFGNIIIKKWDKNVVDLRVEIKADAKNESKSERILDAITIDISDRISSGVLSVKTEIDKIRGNADFSVDYEVYMPVTNPLKLTNSFGNVYLGSYDGELDLEVKYGQLIAEDLARANIHISFSSAKCEVETLSAGMLDLRYSKMEIENMGDIEISSQFSELEVENAGALRLDGRYGSFEFENLKSMRGDIQFSGLDIENLDEFIELETRHGDGINLENVSKKFSKVDIDGQFSTVDITMENGATALLDFDLQFGNLSAKGSGINFNKVIKEHNSSEYEGYLGKNNANALVKVAARYGNIRFRAN